MNLLSVSASPVAMLQQSQTVITLLSDIKDKPVKARTLILELSNTLGLLQSLRFVEEKKQEETDWPKI